MQNSQINAKGKVLCFSPRPSEPFWGGEPFPILGAARMVIAAGYDFQLVLSVRGKDFAREIKEEAPGCLAFGVSVMTGYPILEAILASRAFRAANPNAPVIWGGWHPSILPEQVLENSCVDIVVMGQGERAFLEVMDAFSAGKKLEGIAGVAYRDGKNIVKNPARPLEDVNHFPAMPYDKIRLDDYVLPSFLGKRTIRYASSQGCPHRCGFCVDPIVYGRKWSGLSPERVVDEIGALAKDHGIDGVIFTDSNFFTDLGRALKIGEMLLEKRVRIQWGQVNGRTRQLLRYGEKEWRVLKQSGLCNILVGAESGMQKGLDLINKDASIEDTHALAEACNRAGITINFSMMVGLPYGIGTLAQQEEMVREEFTHILGMMDSIYRKHGTQNSAQLFVYAPYPGTPLYEKSLTLGFPETSKLEGWAGFELGSRNTPWVPPDIIRKVAMLNRYVFRWMEDDWFTKLRAISSPFRPLLLLGGHALTFLARLRWRFKYFGMPLDYLLMKAALSKVMMLHVKKV